MVEGQSDDPRIPIVTFAARQRDIGEMVGEQYAGAGADAEAVKAALTWWEGRFDVIKLEDRNLPAIVEKRVVRPKTEEAQRTLDAAFDRMRASLGNVAWGTLLGEIGDEKGFRLVYPFSLALIEALVAMSHYLQRERTALEVLVELLVEHMDDFEIGKVVPVGDLFEDEERLRSYAAHHAETPTIVWPPSFFAGTPLRDLADLVVIDRILSARVELPAVPGGDAGGADPGRARPRVVAAGLGVHRSSRRAYRRRRSRPTWRSG